MIERFHRPEQTPAVTTTVSDVGISGGSYTPWGAIFAGALAGFATTVILGTLGMAIGVTAGAAMTESGTNAEEAATGLGIGSAIWWLLTVIVTAIVGGAVLARMARTDRPYMPGIYGTLTWITGACVMLFFLTFGFGSILSGALAGAGDALGRTQDQNVSMRGGQAADESFGDVGLQDRDSEPLPGRREQQPIDQQTKETVAGVSTAAAWGLLVSQLVGLGVTILAARRFRQRIYRAPEVSPPSSSNP